MPRGPRTNFHKAFTKSILSSEAVISWRPSGPWPRRQPLPALGEFPFLESFLLPFLPSFLLRCLPRLPPVSPQVSVSVYSIVWVSIHPLCVRAKWLPSCPTLCDSVDSSPTRLLCPWDSPGKKSGVGCHFLLQGIFLTQESNLHLWRLLHYRQILHPLAYQRTRRHRKISECICRVSPRYCLKIKEVTLLIFF